MESRYYIHGILPPVATGVRMTLKCHMPKIKNLKAREILDSRGYPTIETKVELDNGLAAIASVPSGTSTGVHEAWELRDDDMKRYKGMGVLKAIDIIEKKIIKVVASLEVTKQEEIDQAMIKLDGTENKNKLGANSILSVSSACARAAAKAQGLELYEYITKTYKFSEQYRLPTPFFNIFNGGKHADTNLDFQEFMIIPLGSVSFKEKVRIGAEIYHELGDVLKESAFDTDSGSEGGYAPDLISSMQAIEFIMAAIVRAGYKPGKEVGLGTDVGSSELYDPRTKEYIFKLDQAHFTKDSLIGVYNEWLRKFPLISIEDGLAEDDWDGWQELTKELGNEILLIGDDIFTTSTKRLRQGLKEKIANAVIIKLNQVGTLTEAIECAQLAQKHNYKLMVSHRSGETCDDFIADLAVAINAEYIKAGSLSRGERVIKYNRLMEIEDQLIS